MTLREQIEALPVIGSASASWDKYGTLHLDTTGSHHMISREAVLAIIDQHECDDWEAGYQQALAEDHRSYGNAGPDRTRTFVVPPPVGPRPTPPPVQVLPPSDPTLFATEYGPISVTPHVCIPDRDALARALDGPVDRQFGYSFSAALMSMGVGPERLADAIIAALKEQP